MNAKQFFAGGNPGETYGQGVRRRIKSAASIWGLALVAAIVTYAAFAIFGSIWLTLSVAAICGIAASRIDVGLNPPQGEAPGASDRRLWLLLFVPALALLAAASIDVSLHATDGLAIFGAALLAALFGWVLGLTIAMVTSVDSRARVEGTTSTTSASSDQ